jgi:hypothetical protein
VFPAPVAAGAGGWVRRTRERWKEHP